MKQVYRVLAFAIAALVALQAAVLAYGVFSLAKFIDEGNSVDKSTETFPGVVGLVAHNIGGTMLIPAVALLLLICSFFAHVAGGVKWALIVFVTVVVQVALGLFAHGLPALGVLHGIVALVLFGVSVSAAMRVRSTAPRAVQMDDLPSTRAAV